MNPKVIGFLGFDGINSLDLAATMETFAAANKEGPNASSHGRYELIVIGVSGKTFVSEAGIAFTTEQTIGATLRLDTIVIPGGTGIRKSETNRKIAHWLGNQADRVRRIASVSTGIYGLAPTGLLDGRHVTTHWRFCRDVVTRFPKLHVNFAASFLKDGPFYTCGGGSAGMEMALALIEEDYGGRVALSVASELVMRLRPPGDDECEIDPSQYQCGPMDRLAELPAWIIAHLQEKLTLEILAERTGVSPRQFGRVFRSVFNNTPMRFVEELRLNKARHQLLGPRNGVENVATAIGFKSADSFRRAFMRHYGVTPKAFRNRFQFSAGDIAYDGNGIQTTIAPHRRVMTR
jgi:transcriptional regulator GlxA family with amidase domain